MENNFMQIIKTRRSCRHYRDEQVDDQLLHTVMEAGHTHRRATERRIRRLWLCRTLHSSSVWLLSMPRSWAWTAIPTTTPLPICSCLHPKTIPTLSKTDRACLRI